MSFVLSVLLGLFVCDGAPIDAGMSPSGVSCRYECICFRTNGYRCLRAYEERCDGRECWQCQDKVTRKARLSCSIGEPIRSCFCKPFKKGRSASDCSNRRHASGRRG
ncbi:MAG: hypothetical protein RBU30_25050 [Polyangia bacterium]|jgi:hypothetical protein|nr:hypothetical protein [Polyangia bacterium]